MTFKCYDRLPEEAKAIRTAVFVGEQGFETEFDDIDDVARHIVMYDGERAGATCRYYKGKGGEYHIGRIAVVRGERGKNYGAAVLAEGERAAAEEGGTLAVVSAQVRARGFYEKQGYSAVGGEYLDESCPHIKMVKPLA